MGFTHLLGTYATQEEALTSLKQVLLEKRQELKEKNTQQTAEGIRATVTPDKQLISLISSIESIDKTLNALTKKLREWYKEYNPELEHTYRDHDAFIEQALQSNNTGTLLGGQFSEEDEAILLSQIATLQQVKIQREALFTHLEKRMQTLTPNLAAVAGTMVGAKLLQLAGGLERLAMLPAGTIQVLGAETALFRHLRNKSIRPPKHGIIFNHQAIQRAPRNKHGKVARVLADTIAIAARIDFFKGEFLGEKLRKKVEEAGR